MKQERRSLRIALAGNPNSGKTTLFNAITGARHHVGNWPGVTVEKKEGIARFDGIELTVVDLPGTYSLTAYSIEEIVARRFIVHEKPDVVVHVIDSGNLERNLFLTTQLLQLGSKVVLALNMADSVERSGARIDAEKLGSLLGAPAVFTVGHKGIGIRELMELVVKVARDGHPQVRRVRIPYGDEIESHLRPLTETAEALDLFEIPHPPRWVVIKALENDAEIVQAIRGSGPKGAPLLKEIEETRRHLFSLYREEPETVFTERLYGFVAGILKKVYTDPPKDRIYRSDQIDAVLTHRVLGLPVFFLMVWAVFQLTFAVGGAPMEWIDTLVSWSAGLLSARMSQGLLKSLLVDGAIRGVGSVLVFLPNIFILFLCISFLEDSGYMARAAFLTDRVMHLLGLHGKAFIPMMMGFGCNAPAIMATRTLESERDRILSILINPLMSCSARLPVYVLITGAFFLPEQAGTVIFSLYLLGLVLAIAMGRLFSKTILPGKAAPFVMELPPYRLPTVRGLLIHTWDRGNIFLRKMGGVILLGSLAIWALSAFPREVSFSRNYDAEIAGLRAQIEGREDSSLPTSDIEEKIADLELYRESERIEASYIGQIGKALEPVFRPLSFDWRDAVALLTGFVAKEIVVSTLGVLHHEGAEEDENSEGLIHALRRSGMTPLVAYAFMAFVLIYTPCLGTVAVIRRETSSWKWTAFSVAYAVVLAWLVAFTIVHVGSLLGLG
jgi:ferrous iron transport protein B